MDDVINFDKNAPTGGWGRSLRHLFGFVRALRRHQFDVVLVPSTVSLSFTSHLLAYVSGAKVRIGARSIDGQQNPFGYLLNHSIDLDWRNNTRYHQTQRNLDFGRPLGATKAGLSLEMTLTKQEIDIGKALYLNGIDSNSSAIGFHPGAGKKPNCWPPDRFALLVNILSQEKKATPFITAGLMDTKAVEEMVRGLEIPYYLVQNQPVRTVASILSNLSLVITNDTGIMHVAAAVGVPVLSLFGPTDPHQWAPIDAKHRYIISKDGTMASISVEEVLSAARQMLP